MHSVLFYSSNSFRSFVIDTNLSLTDPVKNADNTPRVINYIAYRGD